MRASFNLFTKKKLFTLDEVKHRFFINPHHQWILEDKHIFRAFNTLIDQLPPQSYPFFARKDVLFLRVGGELAGAFRGGQENGYVLLFEDLIKILHSAAWYLGIAILSHELGHLYFNHSNKGINTLQAQFEADEFARLCGLGSELIQVLSDYQDQEFCAQRIERLKNNIKRNSN